MLVKDEFILAKIEASYNDGTTTPANTDAILVENLTKGFDSTRMIERPALRASLGNLQKLYAGTLMMVSFDVEIKGSGTAGTAPEIGTLLRGAGCSETIVASTSVTYAHTSVSSSHESLVLWYYEDGAVQKITGARCASLSINASVNDGPGKISFTFVGHDAGRTAATPPTPTYDSVIPPAFLNASVDIGGYGPVISAITMDLGLTLSKQPDASAADGFGEMIITGRNPTGSLDPVAVLPAAHDFHAILKAGTSMSLTTGAIGGTAGNKWTLSAGEVYYDVFSEGDREGIRTYDVPIGITDQTTTDNDFVLAFT